MEIKMIKLRNKIFFDFRNKIRDKKRLDITIKKLPLSPVRKTKTTPDKEIIKKIIDGFMNFSDIKVINPQITGRLILAM